MANNYRIVIPGEVFKDEMLEMRRRLAGMIAVNDPIPFFTLFFEHFELTAENQSLKRKMLAREGFVVIAPDTYASDGKAIRHVLKNIGPNLDEVDLYLPRKLVVGTRISAHSVTFTFKDTPPLIELSRVPPELGLGKRFVFDSLVWDDAGALYRFLQEAEPSNVLEIFVDVAKGATASFGGSPLTLGTRVRLASAQLLSGGPCCSGFETAPPVPGGPLCFRLHAKILVPPAISVQEQVQAVADLFAPAQISLTLASVQYLTLPEFDDLDVGRCRSGETTAEQNALFQHRNGAAAMDVCAYWVRSMTSVDGATIGCAAHPRSVPAVALIGSGWMTKWVLAHELAHVFGLTHVREKCIGPLPNLMNPCDDFTSPPPDLSADENTTMRLSGYRSGFMSHC